LLRCETTGQNELSDHKAEPAQVREALDRVLQSHGFRASRRSQDFLRYVVERTGDVSFQDLRSATVLIGYSYTRWREISKAPQAMLVEVAGITQYGTEAPADLITTPASPKVVATYFW
jgi:hypothetical protein